MREALISNEYSRYFGLEAHKENNLGARKHDDDLLTLCHNSREKLLDSCVLFCKSYITGSVQLSRLRKKENISFKSSRIFDGFYL